MIQPDPGPCQKNTAATIKALIAAVAALMGVVLWLSCSLRSAIKGWGSYFQMEWRALFPTQFRCLLIIFVAFQALEARAQDWIARVDRSVVRVVVGNAYEPTGTGTGWVVAAGGYIVTNHHVIDGSVRQFVIFRNADGNTQSLEAQIVTQSPPNDLVILKIAADLAPLKVSAQVPAKGADVFAIGFPAAADSLNYKDEGGAIESTVTSGKVGRIIQGRLFNSDDNQGFASTTWIQHSAAISGGNSGGPLFDSCGRVVGVNTAGALGKVHLETGSVEVPQGIQFAAPIENVISLVRQSGAGIATQEDGAACGGSSDAGQSAGAATPSVFSENSTSKGDGTLWPFVGMMAVFAAAIVAIALFGRRSPVPAGSAAQVQARSQATYDGSGVAQPRHGSASWVLKGKTSAGVPLEIQMSSGKEATIGRSQQLSTYAIDDPTVSRNHLMIKFKSDGAIIRDLGSANGTSLDGVSIGKSEKMVKSGQIIKIGKVELFLFKKFR